MADYIRNESNIIITGSEEADSIISTGNNVTINAGVGTSVKVSINGNILTK